MAARATTMQATIARARRTRASTRSGPRRSHVDRRAASAMWRRRARERPARARRTDMPPRSLAVPGPRMAAHAITTRAIIAPERRIHAWTRSRWRPSRAGRRLVNATSRRHVRDRPAHVRRTRLHRRRRPARDRRTAECATTTWATIVRDRRTHVSMPSGLPPSPAGRTRAHATSQRRVRDRLARVLRTPLSRHPRAARACRTAARATTIPAIIARGRGTRASTRSDLRPLPAGPRMANATWRRRARERPEHVRLIRLRRQRRRARDRRTRARATTILAIIARE